MDPEQTPPVQPEPTSTPEQPSVAPGSVEPQAPDFTEPEIPASTVPEPVPPVTPSPVTPGGFSAPTSLPPKVFISPNQRSKKWLVSSIILILLIAGAAYYYFGYYMSPGTIWKQSLSNTGNGYTKLVSDLNKESVTHYLGSKASGNLKINIGNASYSGTLSEQSNGLSTTSNLSVGLGVTTLGLNAVTIKVPGSTTPDVYLKFSGFKTLGLGTELDIPEQKLDTLDGQWIEISHTVLNGLKTDVTPKASSSSNPLTRQAIITTANQVGSVNNQYIWTTNSSKSVTKVIKNYGFATVGGIKTYHYKVGFVKQNVKAYLVALGTALNSSPVGKWSNKEFGHPVDSTLNFSSLEADTSSINSKDTVDIWVNTNTRLIYQVRISDPTNAATNYVDIGLNYTKGNTYPFFIDDITGSPASSKSSLSFVSSFNTDTNSIDTNIAYTSSGVNFSGNINYQPSNLALNLTAPSGAISLQTALGNLGLGSLLNSYLSTIQGLAASSAGAQAL
jgi:hypothetical protein